MTNELLRQSPLFIGLSEPDLNRMVGMSSRQSVPAGSLLIQEGDLGNNMFVVLDGELEVTKHSEVKEVVLARLGRGEIVGEMALFEQAPRNASVRALRDSTVLDVSKEVFENLVYANPATLLAMLRTVTSRMRDIESLMQQNAKMAELGKLAAGLAHELNNPAAAARRSAAQLKDQLTAWLNRAAELDAMHLNDRQVAARSRLRQGMAERTRLSNDTDAVTRSDLENDLQTWLESVGVSAAWGAAPVLMACSWKADELRVSTQEFTAQQLPVLLAWLSAGYAVYELLNEVRVSAERISDMVKVVKEYSYLGQSPIQQVDIHDGLENTLLMMKGRLNNGITVIRDYAHDLPRIEAYAGELNQVWTNIIDNAIDAMQEKGELHLRTAMAEGWVSVEICDNGPGIPADVQPHIFDQFFTTKPLGAGTGQGLHIAYNIVVHKHHGEIKVTSRPGKTCFLVFLPQRVERE